MTQDELDNELRTWFLSLVRDASQLAKENRDVESLGQLAQLVGTCIDWDKEKPVAQPIGFHSNREEEDE